MKKFRSLFVTILSVILLFTVQSKAAEPDLDPLVKLILESDDPQFQWDILRGMQDGLSGRRKMEMPEAWSELENRLMRSDNKGIRSLTLDLSLLFGSESAKSELKKMVQDTSIPSGDRRRALNSLVDYRAEGMVDILSGLLSDPELRGEAVRALPGYQDERIADRLIDVYDGLAAVDRRSALNTLAARPGYARKMMDAFQRGDLPKQDLTADLIRQLRSLKDTQVNQTVEAVWGRFTESGEDKVKEIERLKQVYYAGGSTPGDASRGRAVYARVCQQCHALFDTGGSLGPDLTGSNRGDLDYLLQNIVDPNAVMPNEYRASTLETRDDRVITGIVGAQDNQAVTIQTADQRFVIPRNEIARLVQEELSMMPEGLLTGLKDQEIRDLIYYLRGPAQASLKATPETLDLFFNEYDLTNWEGNTALWRVENGEIVGKSTEGLSKNEFLIGQMIFNDFRLICEVKLVPNTENSGIQFRSIPEDGGSVRGYQADIGQGWWGKLYEEHGRALLWDKGGDAHVRVNDWNRYEILAVGHKIQTAINGHLCVDLEDPKGALSGIIALQLHSGGPMEIRFRNFEIEVNPNKTLRTLD